MKRVVAVLMVCVMMVVMIVPVASGNADRKDTADVMTNYAVTYLEIYLDFYKEHGTFTDYDLEMAYSYYMLYLATKRMSDMETADNVAFFVNLGGDSYMNTTDAIDSFRLNYLKEKTDRDKYEKLLMMMVESSLE